MVWFCLQVSVVAHGLKLRSTVLNVLPGESHNYDTTIFFCFTVWPKIIQKVDLQPALHHIETDYTLYIYTYIFTVFWSLKDLKKKKSEVGSNNCSSSWTRRVYVLDLVWPYMLVTLCTSFFFFSFFLLSDRTVQIGVWVLSRLWGLKLLAQEKCKDIMSIIKHPIYLLMPAFFEL